MPLEVVRMLGVGLAGVEREVHRCRAVVDGTEPRFGKGVEQRRIVFGAEVTVVPLVDGIGDRYVASLDELLDDGLSHLT